MQAEIRRVGGYSLTVTQRLAEGGFGIVDLAVDSVGREVVLKRCYLIKPESFGNSLKEKLPFLYHVIL